LERSARPDFLLSDLDRKDTAILKGLAISAIVFHNFFHVFGPVKENEFTFDPARFEVFLHALVHPSTAIQSLFAFYGHFGVQIFIFLSAYGLARSHWNDTSSWSSFMWSRVKKFYPMFGLAVLFWALLAAMQMGVIWVIGDAGPGLLFMFVGISSFVPGLGLPPVGPWWFIPFIMQFYAIWPLLRWLTRKFGWQGLLALSILCFLVTSAANPVLAHSMINLMETPIGRMRSICLGIIAARYPIRINVYLAIPAFAIIILGSQHLEIAPFVSLASVVLCLCLYLKTRTLLRRFRILEQIGTYSLAIFLINGIVRVPFVEFATTPLLQLALGCASAFVTFAISACFHFLLRPSRTSAIDVPHSTVNEPVDTVDLMPDRLRFAETVAADVPTE
jgi:peptidoglycan/LPS O-acetylase OafA/YrhL